MTKLNTKANLADPDAFYAQLIDTHEGLTDNESAALNARLVLLLANHIGEHAILTQALEAAKPLIVPDNKNESLGDVR